MSSSTEKFEAGERIRQAKADLNSEEGLIDGIIEAFSAPNGVTSGNLQKVWRRYVRLSRPGKAFVHAAIGYPLWAEIEKAGAVVDKERGIFEPVPEFKLD